MTTAVTRLTGVIAVSPTVKSSPLRNAPSYSRRDGSGSAGGVKDGGGVSVSGLRRSWSIENIRSL